MKRRPAFVPATKIVIAAIIAITALLAPSFSDLALVQPSAHAQNKPKKDDKSGAATNLFGETVTVNVVNVEVFVTDKKGNRVTGLTKDDFELFENKRPMAITNFYAIEGGKPTAPPAPPAAPGEAIVEAVEPPGPPAEDQRLLLVVYVDNFNLRPFNRNRVLREMRTFIDQKLTRGDLMMLVTYDRSVNIRQPFTSDPGLINQALVGLEKISAQGVHADSERRDVLQRIEESESANEAVSWARAYSESTFNDLSFSVDSLRDIVNGLAGTPGRKAVLYVSDGLQMIAGQDVFHAVQAKYAEGANLTQSFEFDASRRFRELTATANANRVTFYTIDAAGLRAYSSISAENQSAGQGVFIDQIQIQNLQSTLQMMAEDTGGRAILNSNQVGPQLDRIADDFKSFYSLGYSPPHNGDGRYHEIEVKLKNKKGLTVRHRAGYRDKTADTKMSDGTLASLSFPFQSNPMNLEIEFGTPKAREDGYYLVPVDVKIPLGKLVLIPRDSAHEASIRIYVAAADSEGGTSEVQQTPVPIRIPSADIERAVTQSYTYTITLLMRQGEQKVAVGLRDDLAGAVSFVSRGVRIGR
jgi:VWFA-related protein